MAKSAYNHGNMLRKFERFLDSCNRTKPIIKPDSYIKIDCENPYGESVFVIPVYSNLNNFYIEISESWGLSDIKKEFKIIYHQGPSFGYCNLPEKNLSDEIVQNENQLYPFYSRDKIYFKSNESPKNTIEELVDGYYHGFKIKSIEYLKEDEGLLFYSKMLGKKALATKHFKINS